MYPREAVVRQLHNIVSVLVTLGLTGFALVALAGVEPRAMGDDVFAMLTKGGEALSQSNLAGAQAEFEKVIKADFDNPFANNNMAVLMEKQGKLTDAMTYLNIGDKFAGQYLNKVEKVYLIGGITAAVKPEKATTEESMIAQVIADNKKKITEKMEATSGDTLKKAAK